MPYVKGWKLMVLFYIFTSAIPWIIYELLTTPAKEVQYSKQLSINNYQNKQLVRRNFNLLLPSWSHLIDCKSVSHKDPGRKKRENKFSIHRIFSEMKHIYLKTTTQKACYNISSYRIYHQNQCRITSIQLNANAKKRKTSVLPHCWPFDAQAPPPSVWALWLPA